jgi:hypothetical protein
MSPAMDSRDGLILDPIKEVAAPLSLINLVADFADALAAIDASGLAHKHFQPGIGPFGEADAARAAVARLKKVRPDCYGAAQTKRHPDLLIPGAWAIALKVIRPFGDNGKPAEHWSENILHPYVGSTSSLGDCLTLLDSPLSERKAILIIGYEHDSPITPLAPAIRGFEILARDVIAVHLSDRVEQLRNGLIDPVHRQLRVFGYEILGRR